MAVDAFISYSHAADPRLAPALEHGLERLARPWNRLRAISVFRDQSDLSLTPHLWPTISATLDGARWLVLLASPASAASPWVGREIVHWCDTKGVERLLLVLTDGELEWDDAAGDFTAGSTALNPALRGRFGDEPLHLDLRWAREAPELSLSLSRFRAAIAQIAAPIRGMPPDEIEGEDIRLHRRAQRLARSAVAALTALTLAVAVAAVLAIVNAQHARQRAKEATGRQVGLAALDLPASDIDRAFLLSLAGADLDPHGPDPFRPAQELIGRNPRLRWLLHVPGDQDLVSVRAVALAPGGDRLLATAWRPDGSIGLLAWSLADRQPRQVAVIPPGPDLTGLLVLPDSSAVLGAPGGPVSVVGPDGAVRALGARALALDGPAGLAVVATAAGRLELVDLAGGGIRSQIDAPAAGALADIRADTVAVVAGGRLSVLAASGGAPHSATVSEVVAMAATGAGALVASSDRIVAWRTEGARLVPGSSWPLPAELGVVRSLVPSPDARRALVVAGTGTAVVDLTSGAIVGRNDVAPGEVSVDPSGRYAAVGGEQLSLWDLDTGARVLAVPLPAATAAWSGRCDARLPCRLVTAGESLDVWVPRGRRVMLADQTNAQAVAVSSDGTTVASAGWGPTAAIWSMASPGASGQPFTGRRVVPSGGQVRIEGGGGSTVSVDPDGATRLLLAPGGQRLLGLTGSRVLLWNATTGAAVGLDPRCAGDLVAISPSGEFVAVQRVSDGATRLCRLDTGAVAAGSRITPRGGPATVLAVDDGGAIALGRAGAVEWYPRTGDRWSQGITVDARLGGVGVEVRSLSLREGVVAAGLRRAGESGGVLVWHAASGGAAVRFDLDQTDVPAVTLLGPHGDLLAVAGRDAATGPVTVTVWEAVTRRRVGRGLLGLSGEVVSLSGDGSAVVGTDAGGHAVQWPLDLDPGREICDIVGRSLTPSEWQSAVAGALRPYPASPVCPRP